MAQHACGMHRSDLVSRGRTTLWTGQEAMLNVSRQGRESVSVLRARERISDEQCAVRSERRTVSSSL